MQNKIELLQRMVVPALLLLYFPAVGLLGVVIRRWKPSVAAARRLQLRFWAWAHARAEALWHWTYYARLKRLQDRNGTTYLWDAPPIVYMLPQPDSRPRDMFIYPLDEHAAHGGHNDIMATVKCGDA